MRRLTKSLVRHWPRIAITLLPVVLALVHAAGWWRLPLLDRLDTIAYDARLRATMPRTLDPRIVIVDIDDASLQAIGQWPWRRDRMAQLTHELIDRQAAAAVGFDVIFAESERNGGAADLQDLLAIARRAAVPDLEAEIRNLSARPDHDDAFARALTHRKVLLGFYFTQASQVGGRGELPAPVLPADAFPASSAQVASWNSFGASIPVLSAAASAGFLNVVFDSEGDGVVRSAPLIARYDPGAGGAAGAAGFYESLALAVYRRAVNASVPYPRFEPSSRDSAGSSVLQALVMARPQGPLAVPVDPHGSVLVPYRGPGGAKGGSFRYISAADVLRGRLTPGELAGKIVLVGASAPGLQDLRATPVGAVYPGVEVHASVISGLLDQRFLVVPDDAVGYEVVMILMLGGVLALGLTVLSPVRAVLLAVLAAAAAVGINHALFAHAGLVLPQAATLLMVAVALLLNMAWGYFIEARTRRGLASIFGTYVPPQLVNEMLRNPRRYSMRAQSKELTVMFCDMRGFTRLSEQMAPAELQELLNQIFSRLTEIISQHRGTVDKYIGDCVMAFWGAPVDTPDHASLAVDAALEMVDAVWDINARRRAVGMPAIQVGIGMNTGTMRVGDMGSAHRRSYTVIGDAVNLAARLEGVGEHYGVDIVAGEATRLAATGHLWQQVDRIHVKGKAQPVTVYTPRGLRDGASAEQIDELALWDRVLAAFAAARWEEAGQGLQSLRARHEENVLYRVYAQRLASLRERSLDDGGMAPPSPGSGDMP